MTSTLPDTRSPTVLIVEDEPGLRSALALLLEIEGFTVREAAHGAQALEVLANERFDIIVTDFTMPRMDGDELIRRIREHPNHAEVPIVLMSAALRPEQQLALPVQAFLQKPFPIQKLVDTLHGLLPKG